MPLTPRLVLAAGRYYEPEFGPRWVIMRGPPEMPRMLNLAIGSNSTQVYSRTQFTPPPGAQRQPPT